VEKYEKALYEMINELEEKHLCFPFVITKEELNKYTKKLVKNNPIKDDYDFVYDANCIIKKAMGTYDSHTKASYKKLVGSNIPIKLKMENNKFYIIKTDKEHKDMELSQVLKINGIDVNKLKDELDNMISYSTKGWFIGCVEYYLREVYYLRALPSIDNKCKEITYTIKDQNNNIKNVSFDADKNYERIEVAKENYTYKIIDNTLVITYSSCEEREKNEMNNFVKKIDKTSKDNDIKNYIIDVRNNTGGNSSIIKPLIEYLKGKDIITLVNSSVFSSGRWAVNDLKSIGSKLVGTELGTALNCFGNSSGIIESEECNNIRLRYSTSYFFLKNDILEGYYTQEDFTKHKNDHEVINQSYYNPDIYVENTIDDYKNGTDRQLEVALKELNKTKEK